MVVVQQVSGLFPLPPGQPFNNCYRFFLNGTWDETGAPTGGNWTQDNNGSRPRYTVDGTAAAGTLLFEQLGQVTPNGSTGILQLVADSTVPIPGLGDFEFLSVGFEIDMAVASDKTNVLRPRVFLDT